MKSARFLLAAAVGVAGCTIDSTGIVSFVCDSVSKSLAVRGNDSKYDHAARMRPGRAYIDLYARRSASDIDRALSAAKSFQKCSKYVRSRPCTNASGVGPLKRKCQMPGLLYTASQPATPGRKASITTSFSVSAGNCAA